MRTLAWALGGLVTSAFALMIVLLMSTHESRSKKIVGSLAVAGRPPGEESFQRSIAAAYLSASAAEVASATGRFETQRLKEQQEEEEKQPHVGHSTANVENRQEKPNRRSLVTRHGCTPSSKLGQEGALPCVCAGFVASVVDIPHSSQQGASYVRYAMWKPGKEYTLPSELLHRREYLFGDVQHLLPKAAFNPTLLELPRHIAAALHPDAHFLLVVRHIRGFCRRAGIRPVSRWRDAKRSSMLVMDSSLTKTLLMGILPITLEDIRLTALSGHDDDWRQDRSNNTQIILSGTSIRNIQKRLPTSVWKVFELVLAVVDSKDAMLSGKNFTTTAQSPRSRPSCPKTLRTELRQYEYGGLSDSVGPSRFIGKNLGLFWNGDLRILWMLTDPVDVRQWTDTSVQGQKGIPVQPDKYRANGHPLPLPHLHAFLAVGHTQREDKRITVGLKRRRLYLHRFVLFDAKPPYRWLRASRPFCIPAISNVSHLPHMHEDVQWCEGRQFIMSLTLNGSDILIAYGVNDCEPAFASIQLQSVLNLMDTSWSYELPDDQVG